MFPSYVVNCRNQITFHSPGCSSLLQLVDRTLLCLKFLRALPRSHIVTSFSCKCPSTVRPSFTKQPQCPQYMIRILRYWNSRWEIADTAPVGSPYNSTEGIAFLNNFVDKVTASEKKNKGDKHIGSYYNYCDPELGNHTQAGVHYWGESNYDRLSKLKGRFDPFGVFENPQTVKGKK